MIPGGVILASNYRDRCAVCHQYKSALYQGRNCTECTYGKKMMLEVYDIEAAFLNANPGGHMYTMIPDKMVELGFVTKKD